LGYKFSISRKKNKALPLKSFLRAEAKITICLAAVKLLASGDFREKLDKSGTPVLQSSWFLFSTFDQRRSEKRIGCIRIREAEIRRLSKNVASVLPCAILESNGISAKRVLEKRGISKENYRCPIRFSAFLYRSGTDGRTAPALKTRVADGMKFVLRDADDIP